MKISKKQEIPKIAIDHLPGIDFKSFMELYRKCTANKFSFLVIDTILPSYNPLHFWRNV